MDNKGTLVKAIGDRIITPLEYEGFAIMEDRWIDKSDTILYDQNGIIYKLLDYKELCEYVNIINPPSPYFPSQKVNFVSCLKLDKPVKVGDILYIEHEPQEEID